METPEVGTIDMKLEVVTLPVSDVDRAKSFYQSLGWRLGRRLRLWRRLPGGAVHADSLSRCSISFGKGITSGAEPGSVQRLELVVSDIEAAREDLIRRGVEVSELFHRGESGLAPGPDPDVARTSVMPHSAIRTATGGYSRRLGSGFPAGSGTTDDPTSVWPESATSSTRPVA